MNKNLFVINKTDNVGVTLVDDGKAPAGHKIALCDIAKGDKVIKYGCPIGYATQDVKMGEWVHSHNLKTLLGENESYTYYKQEIKPLPYSGSKFLGYKRKSGRVGIRNELWIIAEVGCINSVVVKASRIIQNDSEFTVVPITHPYGCSTLGEDSDNTMMLISSLAINPNAGGTIIVGLGCENCNLGCLKPYFNGKTEDRVRFVNLQDVDDDVKAIQDVAKELIALMKDDKKEEFPLSELTIAVKCGGSDGYSGITANAIIGEVTDMVAGSNGKVIMSEVPEMFGSERLLMARCKDNATFDKLVALINGFKDYFRSFGEPVGENPSPGNKAGGITTLEEKSLGCTQKSGTAPVNDVLEYGQIAKENGLSLAFSPGNDLVSLTAMTASGAVLALFSTGRGTPFGGVIPTIKISSNSVIANKKGDWIDFDGGTALEIGNKLAGQRLFDLVLSTANGKLTKNEINGCKDIAIFKKGVTL